MGSGDLARVRRWDLGHCGSAMMILEFLIAWVGARRTGLGSAQDSEGILMTPRTLVIVTEINRKA